MDGRQEAGWNKEGVGRWGRGKRGLHGRERGWGGRGEAGAESNQQQAEIDAWVKSKKWDSDTVDKWVPPHPPHPRLQSFSIPLVVASSPPRTPSSVATVPEEVRREQARRARPIAPPSAPLCDQSHSPHLPPSHSVIVVVASLLLVVVAPLPHRPALPSTPLAPLAPRRPPPLAPDAALPAQPLARPKGAEARPRPSAT